MDRGWMMDGQPLDWNSSLHLTHEAYRANVNSQQFMWDGVRLCGGYGRGEGSWVGRSVGRMGVRSFGQVVRRSGGR